MSTFSDLKPWKTNVASTSLPKRSQISKQWNITKQSSRHNRQVFYLASAQHKSHYTDCISRLKENIKDPVSKTSQVRQAGIHRRSDCHDNFHQGYVRSTRAMTTVKAAVSIQMSQTGQMMSQNMKCCWLSLPSLNCPQGFLNGGGYSEWSSPSSVLPLCLPLILDHHSHLLMNSLFRSSNHWNQVLCQLKQ